MGTAYTPGLLVSESAVIIKERRLPLKGTVTVDKGDKCRPNDIVARAEIPGMMHTVRVAEDLGLDPAEALSLLSVKEGDEVKADQILAEHRAFFGLFRSQSKTRLAGKVELLSTVTGHVGVRLPSKPVEVDAYLDGTIVDIIENEGVVVETRGAIVQGIFGVGGERTGRLQVIAESPESVLDETMIDESVQDKVIVGGASATLATIQKAADMGARTIVVGAVSDSILAGYLGYDIGIAITGQEDIPASLILTEGFGQLPMAHRTFDLLTKLNGKDVSTNGSTQVRAGVIRPEIICADPDHTREAADHMEGQKLITGARVRIIREPYFGTLATVTSLPPEKETIESGASVRVLLAETDDGKEVRVPRANVEILV